MTVIPIAEADEAKAPSYFSVAGQELQDSKLRLEERSKKRDLMKQVEIASFVPTLPRCLDPIKEDAPSCMDQQSFESSKLITNRLSLLNNHKQFSLLADGSRTLNASLDEDHSSLQKASHGTPQFKIENNSLDYVKIHVLDNNQKTTANYESQ